MINDLGMGIVITLRDLFSRNATNVESSMKSLDASVAASSERMTHNLDRIQKGTMMMGAGMAMLAVPTALIASTAATQRALGEMASLGTKDLQALEDAAESLANQWSGTNKAEFIGAAYDVKSALVNLSDEAVGTFSSMAAITAKATKATTQEMVGTFTTAYGIFKPIMRQYSDMDWAKAFSGALAQTVAAFKTTGPQMADAIKNVGATAAASNIPLHEQLAILGQLQTTMPGSEAGTLYKAFIMKAAEAGKQLGLSFVDAQGRMKGILPILQEVQNRFPDLSQASAQVLIKQAFGSDEAVKFILQMSAGMDTLTQNIDSVEAAMKSGTAVTLEMAQAMNADIGSQFLLARQQVRNLFEMMGRTLLPIVTPVMEGISGVILSMQRLAKSMPGVTQAVLGLTMALGSVLVVVGAVVAAAGTIGVMLPFIKVGLVAIGSAAAGVGSTIATSFLPVAAIIAGIVGIVYLLRQAWVSNFAGIRDSISGFFGHIRLAFDGIRALSASLRDGTGEISAELAEKLQAAGLMGFVTTVFRVYTRIREFVAGYVQAIGHAFGRVRAIMEPPVRALVKALGAVWRAVFSIVEVFGVLGTSADASSFQTFGQVLGTLAGIVLQTAAIILRVLIYPLALIIRVLALIIRTVVVFAKVIVSAFVLAGKAILKFFLPVHLLIEAFRLVARVAYTFWQMLTGDISIVDGFKAIGRAVLRFLTTPFRWAWDIITGYWSGLKSLVTGAGSLLLSLEGIVLHAFAALPGVVFNAGKSLLVAFATGIWSAVTFPYQVLKRALGWLRRLLPFSDAETGPLSDLTASGAAVLRTLAKGMLSMVFLPAKIIGLAFRGLVAVVSKAWGAVQAIGAGVVTAITWPFRKAASLSVSAWSGVKNAAASAWEGMKNAGRTTAGVVTAPFRWISNAATATWAGIRTGAAGLWNGIGAAAVSARETILTPFRWYWDFSKRTWVTMREGAASAWDNIAATVRSARDGIMAPFRWMAEQVTSVWDAIIRGGGAAWNRIANAPAVVVGSLKSIFGVIIQNAQSAWTAVTSSASAAWTRLKAAALTAGDYLTAPFMSMVSGVSNAVDKVKGSVATGFAAAKTDVAGLSKIFSSPIGTLENGLRAVSLRVQGQSEPEPPQWDTLLPAINSLISALTEATRAILLGIGRLASVLGMAAPVLVAGVALAATSMPAGVQTMTPAPALTQTVVVPGIQSTLANMPPVVSGNLPRQSAALRLRPELSRSLSMPPRRAFVDPVLASSLPHVSGVASLQPVIPDLQEMQGNLLLSPVMTGQMPPVLQESHDEQVIRPSVMNPQRAAAIIEQSRLLMETKAARPDAVAPASSNEVHTIKMLLERAISEMQSLADRPIDVTVNTKLDGQQVAQSVYKDLRERKVKNYETL